MTIKFTKRLPYIVTDCPTIVCAEKGYDIVFYDRKNDNGGISSTALGKRSTETAEKVSVVTCNRVGVELGDSVLLSERLINRREHRDFKCLSNAEVILSRLNYWIE